MPRLPKKPQEVWDAQKERIRAYYITDRKTLSETMELMKSEHDFDATKKGISSSTGILASVKEFEEGRLETCPYQEFG